MVLVGKRNSCPGPLSGPSSTEMTELWTLTRPNEAVDVPSGSAGRPVEVVDADADADQSAADAGCPPWAIATAEVDADAIDDCRLLQGEPLGGGASGSPGTPGGGAGSSPVGGATLQCRSD